MSRILITGATAGIGKSTAEIFAENGWDLVLTGRRAERLETIKTELSAKHNVSVDTLAFDVRDQVAVRKAIENASFLSDLDILVNNAGLALGKGTIQEGEFSDWDTMIDTNVKGLLYMTRFIAPTFIKKKTGHIFNIGSIAGKEVYKGGNVYCATKFAVDALTQAMRIEMVPHNVKVTSINPGKVETEFSEVRFKGDKEKAKKVYEKYPPLVGRDIAEVIYFIAARPAHVNINEIIITATGQASAHYEVHTG